jgi:RNA polymerase sigma-70 factor, ECF subfamily
MAVGVTERPGAGDSFDQGNVVSPVRSEAAPLERTEAPSRDFDAMYAEFLPFVWRCLRALGVPRASLDDAAQDVFLVVHRRLGEFRGSSSLRTWLYGIVRRVASNRRRALDRKGRGEPFEDELPSPAPGPAEQAQDAEAAAFVQQFVATLDAKKRDVFLLGLLEGMSMPEVAEALGIPLNTAYSRLRLVRADLQAALSRKGSK